MKSFEIDTKVSFGEGALNRLKYLPYKKYMVISDPFVIESKMIDLVTDRLKEKGVEYILYSNIVADPPIENIVVGVKAMMEYEPDAIIAIGGGAAIDTAKAIKEFASKADSKALNISLIVIPTTSGTGSEVTSFSVVTDTVNKVKIPLIDDIMLPNEAILDVEFVKSVPANVTANTGMDVLAHAMEAYVSTNHNEFSDALAEKAIENIGAFLLRSYYDNNDTHARAKMHISSCLAGIAFNSASLGINHSLAHQLGANYHIPHGMAIAMVMPYAIEYNSEIDEHSRSKKEYKPVVHRYINLAKQLGLVNFNEITTVRALVNWVQFMMKEMNLPFKISTLNCCTKEEYFDRIDEMADAALKDSCTVTNPRATNREDLMEILAKLW